MARVKLTVAEAMQVVSGINDALEETLPKAMAFKLGRIQRELMVDIKLYEEKRQELIEKYKDEKAEEVQVAAKYMGEFRTENNDLLTIPLEKNLDLVSSDELEEAFKKAKAHPKASVWTNLMYVFSDQIRDDSSEEE
jgi:quinol monooxygenase YgiN